MLTNSEKPVMYDLCIVGGGCIGSAAARYASQWGSVCLIGPKEPDERLLLDERDIFGSHYDEGRIARSSAQDLVWSVLAKESISRYRDLEKLTGISFYDEVGFMICGTGNGDYMEMRKECAEKHNVKTTHISNDSLKDQFPYLNISKSDEAIFESENSGFISPRRMIDAQMHIAVKNGCGVIYNTVIEVKRCLKDGNHVMCVMTDDGESIYAEKVLLATGAFTSFRSLLPNDIEVNSALYPITVAKIEISDEDATKLRNMPSISYFGTGADNWKSKYKRLPGNRLKFYLLPPVRYPDGKYYIKIGDSSGTNTAQLTTGNAIKEWFCSDGDEELVRDMVDLNLDIVKGVKMLSYHGDCCVKTVTVTGRPYIDQVHSQLGVALGGNGEAAKSGDEIGRIAAGLMMKNIWDSPLERQLFTVKLV